MVSLKRAKVVASYCRKNGLEKTTKEFKLAPKSVKIYVAKSKKK